MADSRENALRWRPLLNVRGSRCCLCGGRIGERQESLQIGMGKRAHLKCVVKYSFDAYESGRKVLRRFDKKAKEV